MEGEEEDLQGLWAAVSNAQDSASFSQHVGLFSERLTDDVLRDDGAYLAELLLVGGAGGGGVLDVLEKAFARDGAWRVCVCCACCVPAAVVLLLTFSVSR